MVPQPTDRYAIVHPFQCSVRTTIAIASTWPVATGIAASTAAIVAAAASAVTTGTPVVVAVAAIVAVAALTVAASAFSASVVPLPAAP